MGSLKMKTFDVPFYRYKRFGDKYLVTVDNGAWVFLSKSELLELESKNLDDSLLSKLEDALIIKTPDNIDEFDDKHFRSHWYRGNGTSLHIMIPTLRCNHTCKYCYAFRKTEDSKGYDMDKKTAEAAVDFVFQSPAKNLVIEFSGGEPLLRFDIIKHIINKANLLKKKTGKELGFALVTNGSLLDEEKFEFLKANRVGICFSLDGPKELHDYQRKINDPTKSSYEEVVSKIKWLKNQKKYRFVFAIPVITKKSLEKWDKIIDEYVKLGIPVYRFKYLSHFGFASNKKVWGELGYSSEEFIAAWKKTLNYILELNKKGVRELENFTLNILRKLLAPLDPGFAEMQAPCGAVIGQLVYNYDGNIYPCDEARTFPDLKLGRFDEISYSEALEHPITQTMISSSSLVESCYNCVYYPFCGTCPLETYKMKGCFITNIPNSYRCRIHKEMFDYIFGLLSKDEDFLRIAKDWVRMSPG